MEPCKSSIGSHDDSSDPMTTQVIEEGQSNNAKRTSAKPPSSQSGTSGKRKKYSAHWAHFDEVPNSGYAKCKYCGALIGCRTENGTTPMKNHIIRCKKLPSNMDKKQKLLEINTKTVIRDDGVVETIFVPSFWQFDQEVCRKAIARMIIVDELPFAIVEHEVFKYFCKCLNPEFIVPSRFTVARDCYKLYSEERKKLKDCFQRLSGRISLTTDAWTSSQNLSYMCLTAHFIDDDWVLHKRIINFCPLAGHSGQLIGRAVEKCLVDWGIKNIMAVTVDNASSNDLAIAHLRRRFNHWESSILKGKYLHMRCHCHILNLVVKDGLKDIKVSILKVRGLVRYVRSSPARLQKFKLCVEEEKLESKSLVCLDVETRWNSTYLMLQSAIKFKKAFDNLIIRDSTCVKENMKIGVPNDEDWKEVSSFLSILKVFYDATLLLSGSRYVTCNLPAEDVFGVGKMINTNCNEQAEHKNMALKMKAKYDKYWGDIKNINLLMFVAVFLDPRRKLRYVYFLVRKLFDEPKSKILSLNIKSLVEELFDVYASSMPQVNRQSESSTPASSTSNLNECDQRGQVLNFATLLSVEYQMEMGSDCNENKSELDKYLEEACEPTTLNFKILQWWTDNHKRYPIISKMARDVLAIPVSTVSSESAFSTGGRVLDLFRTSLSPTMVEGLICAQDWQRTSNNPIIIEESLLAMQQIDEGLGDLLLEHPAMIIDESDVVLEHPTMIIDEPDVVLEHPTIIVDDE